MKIACHQTNPVHRDVNANVEMIRELVDSSSDLHIFPELALTGYLFTDPSEIRDLAEPIDGNLARQLAEVARTNRTAIITGFLEITNGKYYNAAIAFDSRGKLVGHYRKVHLFYYEKRVFSPGDLGFPVFSLETASGETAKVGLIICYDWRFPEAARSLAIAGAELIAIPSNIVTTTGMLETTLRTRAFENKVCVAFADRVGSESALGENPLNLTFQGKSSIIDMNGDILAQADPTSRTVVQAECHLQATLNKRINEFNDIFGDRSPESYNLQ